MTPKEALAELRKSDAVFILEVKLLIDDYVATAKAEATADETRRSAARVTRFKDGCDDEADKVMLNLISNDILTSGGLSPIDWSIKPRTGGLEVPE